MRVPKKIHVWVGLGLILFCASGAWADQVVVKNGDRLTGKLLFLREGKIAFETDYAGRIEIDQEAVDRISTAGQVSVHLDAGEVLKGRLESRNGELHIHSSAARQATTIDPERITAINPPPAPTPDWKGSFTLGGNRQSGNTDRLDASVSLDAVRKSDNNRINIRLLYNYSEEDEDITSRNTYGMLKYDYFLTEKFYWYLDFEFLEDEFKDLNLRTVVGPGIGYQVWDTEKKFLLFEGGLVYFNEDHIVSEDESWFSGRLASEFRYQFFDRLEFADKFSIFPNLENFGDYQLRNEASLSTTLLANWALNLTHLLERDSAPEPGIKKTDQSWILGLQYRF